MIIEVADCYHGRAGVYATRHQRHVVGGVAP